MLKITVSRKAPRMPPSTLPRPPESATPPITAATIEFELVAAAHPVVDAADIADKHQPSNARKNCARDVTGDHGAIDVDAHEFRSARPAADHVDPAPERRLRERDPDDQSENGEHKQIDRNPEKLVRADQLKLGRNTTGGGAARPGETQALKHDHRRERREKRRHVSFRHKETVGQSHDERHDQRRQKREGKGQPPAPSNCVAMTAAVAITEDTERSKPLTKITMD